MVHQGSSQLGGAGERVERKKKLKSIIYGGDGMIGCVGENSPIVFLFWGAEWRCDFVAEWADV